MKQYKQLHTRIRKVAYIPHEEHSTYARCGVCRNRSDCAVRVVSTSHKHTEYKIHCRQCDRRQTCLVHIQGYIYRDYDA